MPQGSGIGRATAASFDRAGASKLILIGRKEDKLKETQKTLSCPSSTHPASVTDEEAIVGVATTVGSWDVLVLAAGYLSQPATIRDSSVREWWQSFEVRLLSLKVHVTSTNRM